MQIFQHLQRIIWGECTVMDGYIAHFANEMNGIQQDLIVEIACKRIIGGHFKDGFALNVAADGVVNHFNNELHRLSRRSNADIRF